MRKWNLSRNIKLSGLGCQNPSALSLNENNFEYLICHADNILGHLALITSLSQIIMLSQKELQARWKGWVQQGCKGGQRERLLFNYQHFKTRILAKLNLKQVSMLRTATRSQKYNTSCIQKYCFCPCQKLHQVYTLFTFLSSQQ